MRSLDYIVDDVPSFVREVVTHSPTGSTVELGGRLQSPGMRSYELPRSGLFSNQRYSITEQGRAACAAALSGLERPRFDVIGLALHGPTGTYFEAPHFFDSNAPVIFVHESFPLDLLDDLVARGIMHLDPVELPPRPGTSD